jgi:hypothetical protein
VTSQAAQGRDGLLGFMLPKLARCRKPLDAQKHDAIRRICDKRNALMHMDFQDLHKKIPHPAEMLDLFRGFVIAEEDMNVKLGRATCSRKRVLKVGDFR